MERRSVGVIPVGSHALLGAALQSLRKHGVLDGATGDAVIGCTTQLVPYLPSNYFSDIVLEWSLMPSPGAEAPRAALILDARDRSYLNHASDGSYLGEAGIPQALAPADYDQLTGLIASGGRVEPFAMRDTSFDADQLANPSFSAQVCDRPSLPSPASDSFADTLSQLASVRSARVLLQASERRRKLYVGPRYTSTRDRFAETSCGQKVLDILRELGYGPRDLTPLQAAHHACAVSGTTADGKRKDHVVLTDVAYVALCWNGASLSDVQVGLIISDRFPTSTGARLKPSIAYQWHITDECDQRCKHCYLFAEDARLRCVTTPWDQLMHTMDEVERSAAARGIMPMLAVSGGDPLLHPRFWDLADEIHRRGIAWSAMGNPFHVDEAVALRLRQLGCTQYQMSLDGLEPFHDHLRKPGSYQATLAALIPLQKAGVPTQLMATVSRQNMNDVLACMDVAVEHGASSFAFARYCATSPEKAAELYPTAQEYRAFLLAYWNKKQALEQAGCKTVFKTKDHLFTLLRWELGEFSPPPSTGDAGALHAGCHLGAKCTIASNGDLLACRRMPSVVGNLHESGLLETDLGAAMATYADPSAIEKCRDCELLLWCRGCRAVGFNATGNLQGPDPMCWHDPSA